MQNSTSCADEVHTVTTSDLWHIQLFRFKAKTGPGEPVLMCHGFMSNHNNFSNPPGESMAETFAEKGYDVWLIDLRGNQSSVPPFGQSLNSPGLDDYLLRDIPAALEFIRNATGYPKIHWVGHSMGGMLLYAYDAAFGPGLLASATTLGSPIGFEGVPFSRIGIAVLFAFRKASRRLFRGGQWLVAAFNSMIHPKFEHVPVNWDNMNPRFDTAMMFSAIEAPPIPVAKEMAFALENRMLRVKNGTVDVFAGLKKLGVPLYAIFGAADPFVTIDTIESFFTALPNPDKRLLVLSKDNGHAADYSHVDLVYGVQARKDVYEPILQWIGEHAIAKPDDAAKEAFVVAASEVPAVKPKKRVAAKPKPKAAPKPKPTPKLAPKKAAAPKAKAAPVKAAPLKAKPKAAPKADLGKTLAPPRTNPVDALAEIAPQLLPGKSLDERTEPAKKPAAKKAPAAKKKAAAKKPAAPEPK